MSNEEWWAITKEFNFIVFDEASMYWPIYDKTSKYIVILNQVRTKNEDYVLNWCEEMEDQYG